jgi:hypothetical protein
MTTRPTTLVESDQLAQAALNVIRNETLVPRGKRWLFSRLSKASRDYERAVQEITARRRESREKAVEQRIAKERADANAVFERAETSAQQTHAEELAHARQPYNETETQARSERDAAIAAANLVYQQMMDKANRLYLQEAATIDQQRNELVAEAKALRDEAYAALEAKRKADMAQIARDLKTIPLEGPMRIVEDREAWPADERKKALIGIVDMAGRDDFGPEYADLCLRNVMGYVFQDRYLKPDAQHHRLMDVNLLEALVDLARRSPEKRPTIVKYMHDIVVQNPGHSSPTFIKNLTELYVIASSDIKTVYVDDPTENELIFDQMRAHIADSLKLTPRRSQVPPPLTGSGPAREASSVSDVDDDKKTPVMVRRHDEEITADVDVRDLVLFEPTEGPDDVAGEIPLASPDSQPTASSSPPPPSRPRPPGSRGKRRMTEDST